MIIINFIRDKEVGIFARAKRLTRGSTENRKVVLLDGGCADECASQDGCTSSNDENDREGTRRRR